MGLVMRNKDRIAPLKVYVVGKTEFNADELERWADEQEHTANEEYFTSPLFNIQSNPETEVMSEFAGRFCYNSFMKGRPTAEYIANIIEMQHGSVLEHTTYNLVIQGVSRALSHELVRHRAGFAISQESQRYVDAKNIKFVVPPILLHIHEKTGDESIIKEFISGCIHDINRYQDLQKDILANADNMKEAQDFLNKSHTVLRKRANEAARAVLPNAAETKLVWTGNLRSLRHFCELRGGLGADLEIRRLAVEITRIMKDEAPHTFADFEILEGDYGVQYVSVGHHKV